MALAELPLNLTDISRDDLDITDQVRANRLPWKGQFSPQLVEVLLRAYASSEIRVLDPFVGSGTVLGECARLGLRGDGVEVNPAAVLLAQLYEWCNHTRTQRESALAVADALIAAKTSADLVMSASAPDSPVFDPALVGSWAKELDSDAVRRLVEAAIVLADPKPQRLSLSQLVQAQRKVRSFVTTLPLSQAPIRIVQADARKVPLANATIDLVVTSPPYINVFNYHQQYRTAAEALSHDVLSAARSEIGSNRKHRMNRFYTVVQYAIDMAAVLNELTRVMREDARLILVIGRESRVRGTRILNGALLYKVAVAGTGLVPLMRQERAFVNRFGETIVEDILHFERKGAESLIPVQRAISVARELLEGLVDTATGEVQNDIRWAINSADNVTASPLFTS